jgi:cell division septum initiation protein DivIVA
MNMAEKKFLSWVGYKNEDNQAANTPGTPAAPTASAMDRIRELESQLADMRSRRDITGLTREEFEILASETAMTLIKTAQSREARAIAIAEKAVADATRAAKQAIESAEMKAKQVLSAAEGRGRKYLQAAQDEAAEITGTALAEAERLVEAREREAAALASSARREAERLITTATSDILDFKSWLMSAIQESERLHRIQTQSLASAEEAIKQTRGRLSSAFEKLAALGADIEANIGEGNRPHAKAFIRKATKEVRGEEDVPEVPSRTRAKNSPAKKKPAARKKTSKRK